jgi:hypothetical protein
LNDPVFSDPGIRHVIQNAPGSFVEDDVLGIVDWIRAYDEDLDVMCLDPTRMDITPDDPPYIIVEHCRDGVIRIVFRCWTLDERVKERIIAADTQTTDVLSALDAANRATRAAQERAYQDSVGEAKDIMLHIFKNPKTTYRFRNLDGELLTVEDDKGVVKRAGD